MDLAPGVVVAGRYEILGPLGEGAFGVVVRVRDRKGMPFALKVLTHERDARRFERETNIVRLLAHPNVVRLVDAGEHEGKPFVVFELVEGRTLAAEIADGPVAVERVAILSRQVLDALAAAHARGIIHRDIKPANIMVNGDRAKLLDFGIARSLDDSGPQLTGIGEAIGTPQYMSPEQVAAMPIDASTDLYALGLVMSEAITGQPVYTGTLARVLARHASPEPTPIPSSVQASLLGAVILRATQKSPPARFRSAAEMRAAFAPAPTPTPTPRIAKRSSRSRIAIGVVVFAAVAIAYAILAAPPPPSPHELDQATFRLRLPITASHRFAYDVVVQRFTERGLVLVDSTANPPHWVLNFKRKKSDPLLLTVRFQHWSTNLFSETACKTQATEPESRCFVDGLDTLMVTSTDRKLLAIGIDAVNGL